MKTRNIYFLTLISALVLIVSGCSSSGGDSSTPTDPNAVFQLFESGYFTPGYTSTSNYTGSDTNGSKYTATTSEQTQPQSTFLGQPAIPILQQVQITNTSTGASVSNIGTGYFSTSATDRRYLGYSDSSTTTVSAVTSPIPQTAKIGDFGNVGTYTDNAGNVSVQSWRLEDGFNGRAKAIILTTERDQFANLDTSTTSTNLIDTSGNTISSTIVIFYADLNVTVTLNSN